MSGRGDDRPGGEGGDSGAAEISLSVEETNKLRASLGLPPLKETSKKDAAAAEEHKKRKREENDTAAAAELEERVRASRERRRQQDLLSKTKTLGEAEPDVDDVMAWVSKSRQTGAAAPPAQRRKKAKTAAPAAAGEHDAAVDLAGVTVKAGLDDLEAGEEMILTLEDRGILDDKGQLVEEEGLTLENVLQRETKARAKAFADSQKKAKPLWEEDGKRRGLLDKYDEEEEEAFQLDDAGALEASKLKRQDDIRAKLEAAKAAVAAGGAGAVAAGPAAPSGDYYTPEEMAAMKKPKKKKGRKLKKKALTADELAALEEEAAAAGGGGDLGSRADRERRAAERTAAAAAADTERRSRFDAALTKANIASLALRRHDAGVGGDDEEDADLQRSLAKARELAAKKTAAAAAPAGPEALAAALAARRATGGGGAAVPQTGGLTFTDIGEFTRGITVKEETGAVPVKFMAEETGAGPAGAGGGEHAGAPPEEPAVEEEDIPVPMDADVEQKKAEPTGDGAWGSWMPAEAADAEAAAAAEEKAAKRSYRRRAVTDDDLPSKPSGSGPGATQEASVVGEKAIGAGLGAALAFLKERGELKQSVEWAGRTNDSRDSYFTAAMGGYKDVYTGGRAEDQLALDVEVALTRKDKFGRILTPKEAFRQLCHDFHGIKPSKNTTEKREKQVAKELAQRRAATGDVSGTLAGLKAVQEAAHAPYMVLSGTVKPGQHRDAAGAFAARGDEGAMRPPPPRPPPGGKKKK